MKDEKTPLIRHQSPSPRTIAIVQARMTSTRLPAKTMKSLAGSPLLSRVIERVGRIAGLDGICIAVPEGPEHEPLARLVSERHPGVALVRGPEQDVLARYAKAARETGAEAIVRITSDCPFIDPTIAAATLAAFHAAGVAYARTAETGVAQGFGTQVAAASALFEAEREATDPYEREHVMPYIERRTEKFPALRLGSDPTCAHWKLAVDTAEDYARATELYEILLRRNPVFELADLRALADERPDLFSDAPSPPRVSVPAGDAAETTPQLARWRGDFGNRYLARNRVTPDLVEKNRRAFTTMLAACGDSPPASILEVGANVGINLRALKSLTSAMLWALEPFQAAREQIAIDGILPKAQILDGTARAIPLDSSSIDLVFTKGVLIHVPPSELGDSLNEIYRVSRRYILCVEYFSATPETISYRDETDMLFKRDFGALWLERFPNLIPLADGFFWKPTSGLDNVTWWMFEKCGNESR